MEIINISVKVQLLVRERKCERFPLELIIPTCRYVQCACVKECCLCALTVKLACTCLLARVLGLKPCVLRPV